MSAKKKDSKFEEQMKELEGLIEKLEGENLSLEDSLQAFEKAMELGKQCAMQLEKAQQRISVLMQEKDVDMDQVEELKLAVGYIDED